MTAANQIMAKYKIKGESLILAGRVFVSSAMVVFAAYIAASTFGPFLLSGVMSIVVKTEKGAAPIVMPEANLKFEARMNYRDFRKAVIDRNVFNSSKEYPNESVGDEEGQQTQTFNINAPCKKTTLNISLLGTIYAGENGMSLATVKEQSYPEADVYKTGDEVIGVDGARIAKIERQRIIINNNGVKECIELEAVPELIKQQLAASNLPPGAVTPEGGKKAEPVSAECANIVLEQGFVEKELGEGFGKIIQQARLVPNMVENRVNGFKIFAINRGSLFDKVCLQNGDVITKVNEISMEQPEQGFALYQALQDEKELAISILRNGSDPKTINVQIK